MDISIDIKDLCKNLAGATESDPAERLCETDGDRYLYENVLKPCIYDIPLRVCDIDFSAFTEDDIVSLIDDKTNIIDDMFYTVERINTVIGNCKPLAVSERRFF